jgi:transcriptional regulator with XRE-family HTH domain
MQALQEAVDAARNARGLTWVALAAEINVAFESTPSIPISVSTISSMQSKRSVTSAVVLQVLRWLGRTPESFLAEDNAPPQESEVLPDPGPGRILRLDTRALYAALDTERLKRGMKWKQVADELPGFSETMLTNLAKGPLIGFPRVMMIFQWLGRPAASFVRVHNR